MAVNTYHHYLKRSPFTKLFYKNDKEKNHVLEEEAHRQAFMNRVNAFEFHRSYDGEMKFPYTSNDLAHYLHYLCNEHDLINVNNPVEATSPDTDEEYEYVMAGIICSDM